MSLFVIFSALMFLAVVLIYAFKQRQQFYPRPVMTTFEQGMYRNLKLAFPDEHVLAQVAFSALITNQDYKIRRKFNRKVTDFVLLDQHCQVIAIIELDDPSHLSRQQQDQFRDHMLQQAGYQVYRYRQIPAVKQLKQDIYG